MATQTPNLDLTKPAVGADDDVWGGMLNGNWDKLDDIIPEVQSAVLPIGGIIMWSGTIGTIPDGFGLCDGTSYTRTDGAGSIASPDLSSRFVVGSSGDGTGDYQTGSTGGGVGAGAVPVDVTVDAHALSAAESGGHTHGGFWYEGAPNGGNSGQESTTPGVIGAVQGTPGDAKGTNLVYVVGSTGPGLQSGAGSDAHAHSASGNVNLAGVDIDPAWLALAYIMKI